ncbi:MAG: hypothetical protein P4L39_06750 [Humidesulfovibrio sp.]|nr:hypothetical protein [Humidesulfovibrio sp.]
MAKYITGALCSRVIIDKTTNMVSIIDLIRGGAVTKFPFETPEIMIYGEWEASNAAEKTFQMRHILRSPSGKEILNQETKQSIKSGLARTIAGIDGFIADEPGRYTITTFLKQGGKWVSVAEYPLTLWPRKEASSEEDSKKQHSK